MPYLQFTAVAFAVGFAMAFPVYNDDAPPVAVATTNSTEVTEEMPVELKREILKSPLEGELVALADVPNEVFSSGVLGKGIAVNPEVGKVCAPADAEVYQNI